MEERDQARRERNVALDDLGRTRRDLARQTETTAKLAETIHNIGDLVRMDEGFDHGALLDYIERQQRSYDLLLVNRASTADRIIAARDAGADEAYEKCAGELRGLAANMECRGSREKFAAALGVATPFPGQVIRK